VMTGMDNLALRWRQQRFNPLKSLTPTRLSNALDSQEAGWLREAALIYESIEQRDAICRTVINKRKQAVSRRGWQVQIVEGAEDNPRAEQHKEALEHFYQSLTCTDATDLNKRTGMRGLVRQMMGSVMPTYAVHEIIWQQGAGGITAEMRHVPIYFFENRTGKLQFTGADQRSEGEPLDEDGWLITTCDSAVGEAIAIVYMFRRLAVQDWLAFSEKFSIPGVIGRTPHKKGTPEGNAARDAVADFGSQWVGMTYEDDGRLAEPIQIIQTQASAGMPQKEICEYMDRMITILCRGGDLGTLSREDSQGASLQGNESAALLEDDCAMITETLQTQLDPLVLRYALGDSTPLAHVVIDSPADTDETRELAIDNGLGLLGVRQDPDALAQRYGREHTAAPAQPARSYLQAQNEAAPGADTLEAARRAALAPIAEPRMAAANAGAIAELRRLRTRLTTAAPEMEAAVAKLLPQPERLRQAQAAGRRGQLSGLHRPPGSAGQPRPGQESLRLDRGLAGRK